MTVDEERICFFYELGLAVSQWSFVESRIYEIIAACVDEKDRYAIGFGLFAVDNFRSKLAFSDALLKKQIKTRAHLKAWSKLAERLGNTVVKRNKLAHDRVMFYAKAPIGRRFALEHWPSDKPRQQSILKPMKPPSDALSVRDIVECRRDFFYLSLALQNFHATLLGRPLPHPESDARPKGPPTIREIRNQIREALGLPQKPSRKKS